VAILVGLFVFGGRAVGSTNEQTLSVASSWQLPQESKAVCFALSPDGESLALSRTNRDVEIWSTSSHEMLSRFSVEGPLATFLSGICNGGTRLNVQPAW